MAGESPTLRYRDRDSAALVSLRLRSMREAQTSEGASRLYLILLNVYRPRLVQKRCKLSPSATCRYASSCLDGLPVGALRGDSRTTFIVATCQTDLPSIH